MKSNFNLPNLITCSRILIIPVIIGLILERNFGVALWFFLFAGLSDGMDGFIARQFDMRTRLGAMLDPLADKILIVSSVLALAWLELIPVWLTAAVLCRDLVITAGAVAWRLRIGPLEMAPTIISKINTFFQVTTIFLLLGHGAGFINIAPFFPPLFLIVFVSCLLSGVQYILVWGNKALEASCRH